MNGFSTNWNATMKPSDSKSKDTFLNLLERDEARDQSPYINKKKTDPFQATNNNDDLQDLARILPSRTAVQAKNLKTVLRSRANINSMKKANQMM